MLTNFKCVFLFTLIISFFFSSCNKAQSSKIKRNKEYTLTLKRGAFHYDSFIVQKNTITYLSNENDTIVSPINNSQYLNVLDTIIKGDFFRLKNNYSSKNSCTSMLSIELKIDDKTFFVHCDDYKRDCPAIVQQLEALIIKLHGKQLYRTQLPG